LPSQERAAVESESSTLDRLSVTILVFLRGSQSLGIGGGQAVGSDTPLLAAKRELTAPCGNDPRRQREFLQQGAGDDDVQARPLRVLLEACRGIEDVANEIRSAARGPPVPRR